MREHVLEERGSLACRGACSSAVCISLSLSLSYHGNPVGHMLTEEKLLGVTRSGVQWRGGGTRIKAPCSCRKRPAWRGAQKKLSRNEDEQETVLLLHCHFPSSDPRPRGCGGDTSLYDIPTKIHSMYGVLCRFPSTCILSIFSIMLPCCFSPAGLFSMLVFSISLSSRSAGQGWQEPSPAA